MRVLSLISGGKDSCYCMLQCIASGHEIVALGNIKPTPGTDEMDSYMYQSVGHEVIALYAEALDLPLFQRETKGQTVNSTQTYEPSSNDEVEDLYQLLKEAREKIAFEGVSSGAILSNYQRVRVESVCLRLGLVSFAYLWQRDQKELLDEMISSDIKAIVIKTASLGLDPEKVLGVDICNLSQYFSSLNAKYQLNVCGEGGEYETLTLDCPLFKKKIEILDQEIVYITKDDYAPVAFLKIKKACLVDKCMTQELAEFHFKKPSDFVREFDSISDKTEQKIEKFVRTCAFSFDDISPHISIIKKKLWITGLLGREKSIRQSTEHVMQQISTLMHEKGLTMRNLIKINVYIKSMADYMELNAVYKEYFIVNPPVRACVEVPLPSNIQFVMDCQATFGETETLHVQSISNWAPANIGPYSQGVLDDNFIYTSGQIGLVPGLMTLIESSTQNQNSLILRHLTRVLKGVRENVSLKHVVVGFCYTTDGFVADSEWPPLFIPVVVAGLPRNADVEWQVIAQIDVEKVDINYTNVEIQNGVIEMTVCRCDCDNFILFKYRSGMEMMNLDDFKRGLELVDKELDVGYVQVFCIPDDNLEFYKLIEGFFKNCCVSVVPILRFERPDCHLIVFLHGLK
uniref:Diphthine--ammonia ligase n=1 Tax=Strigamia maritima TaxID=126957 RepID=T1JCC9_STRMM